MFIKCLKTSEAILLLNMTIFKNQLKKMSKKWLKRLKHIYRANKEKSHDSNENEFQKIYLGAIKGTIKMRIGKLFVERVERKCLGKEGK